MARPSEIKDLYKRLDVSPCASQDQIKSAYRKLAHQWHPDKNPGKEKESRLEFIAVSEAYIELRDEARPQNKQPEEDSDSYKMYQAIFEELEKSNNELYQMLKMFGVNPSLIRNFGF